MSRLPLSQCCPYFGPDDPFARQRQDAARFKQQARADLIRLGVRPQVIGPPIAGDQGSALIAAGRAREAARASQATARSKAPGGAAVQRPAPKLFDPECKATFDANTKVTTITASAAINCTVDDLVDIVDPRAWGLGDSIIDIAFPVELRGDRYEPLAGDIDVKLGTEWEEPGLLFEYARSDIASFENILRIRRFVREGSSLLVEYDLFDCLKTTIGFFTIDGGMQKNEGHVKVKRNGRDAEIEVVKRIRIRDFTPNDPGDRYDFGESINSTIGAALSVWVDDTSMMSPVF